MDYAGDTVPIVDRHTGETQDASIFVAVLGASNYTYAEASLRQDLPSWLAAHTRALEFLGGCPCVVVPDNTKDAVRRPCRYEPDLNASYADWATHYGVAVIPARVRHPRDKAKAESGVLVVERWILAALRHRTFFSLGELNEAIAELLERLTTRTFRKLPGNRRYLEWSPSRLIHWAQKVGPHTGSVVEKILQSRRYPEQSYRSCLGILRLGSSFGEDRLEQACPRALRLQAYSYKSIQSILKTGLDRQAEPQPLPERSPIEHANVRGAEYFEGEKGASHVG